MVGAPGRINKLERDREQTHKWIDVGESRFLRGCIHLERGGNGSKLINIVLLTILPPFTILRNRAVECCFFSGSSTSTGSERSGKFTHVDPQSGTIIVKIAYLLMRWG